MKNQKGITLIALILTIVVLIILAVVTINAVKGDSIIAQANNATTQYKDKADKENAAIQEWADLIDKYTPQQIDDMTYIQQKLNSTLTENDQGNTVIDENKVVLDPQTGEIVIDGELRLKSSGGLSLAFTTEYNGKVYNVFFDSERTEWTVSPEIRDFNDIFTIYLNNNHVVISGLTDNGKTMVSSEKRLNIPKQITTTDGNTYDVIKINGFSKNTDIEELTFEQGSVVEFIGDGAFAECSNLDNLNIPDSVTNLGLSAFMKCTSLKNVKLPNNKSFEWGISVFSGCTGLTSINIPSNMTEIGYLAFDRCSGLNKVIFEDGNLDLIISDSAFIDCNSLTSITIPKRVTTIKKNAFSRCGLTSVIFEEGSRLNSIGDNAFYWNEINEVTIPSSVTSIGQYAFSRTNRLIIKKEQDSIPGKNWGANYVSWEP